VRTGRTPITNTQAPADRELRAERSARAYAREQGVSPPLYAFVRLLATVLLRLWFRFRVTGTEHVPDEGPAILAPNHKNFLDAFFVGLALGSPHHGAGRLALETGAPIIPTAITGTSHLWRGALPRRKRVQLAFLPAVPPHRSDGRDVASELIDERVWPAVQEEYGRLRASPGMIAAGLAALGLGGGLLAKQRLEASRKPRLLGKVEPRKLRRQKARRRVLDRVRSLR
jgi:1-acyl-sn-glycerol-3-phosphate acyltransferase